VVNVAELRAILTDLPDDMPVVVHDDLNYEPLVTAQPHGWRWDAARHWGDLEHDPEPDDDPDEPQPTQALILTTRNYL
jgi:hypothetical protein